MDKAIHSSAAKDKLYYVDHSSGEGVNEPSHQHGLYI